jgi:hypothetical protein
VPAGRPGSCRTWWEQSPKLMIDGERRLTAKVGSRRTTDVVGTLRIRQNRPSASIRIASGVLPAGPASSACRECRIVAPRQVTVSSMFEVASGHRFNVLAGADLNGDGDGGTPGRRVQSVRPGGTSWISTIFSAPVPAPPLRCRRTVSSSEQVRPDEYRWPPSSVFDMSDVTFPPPRRTAPDG